MKPPLLIWFKDVEKNNIFGVELSKVEDFQEEYENPGDLIIIEDVYYCDGGGFNGKTSKIAFGMDSIKVLEIDEERTNNEMEYLSLITALVFAKEDSLILSDSKLIVNQTTKEWKCNYKHLEKLRDLSKILMKRKNISLSWVSRDKNLAGIKLDMLKRGA